MTDQELVKEYFSGDESAITILVGRHLSGVYNFTFQIVRDQGLAEDIVQETFIKVWKKLDSYKPELNFKTWLFKIAHNTAIDFLRKRKIHTFSEFENSEGDNLIIETFEDSEPLPDELAIKLEQGELLSRLVGQISAADREILFLHLNQDLSFDEIAQISGESINTAKSRYRRALIKLRQSAERMK